jgi:hypothetical protein
MATAAAVAVLLTAVSSHVLTGRRVMDRRQQHIQATWLARSGLELATARLLSNESYRGETIEMIPESQVHVEIKTDSKTPGTFLISSEARISAKGTNGTVTTLKRTVRRIVEKDRIRLEIGPRELAR